MSAGTAPGFLHDLRRKGADLAEQEPDSLPASGSSGFWRPVLQPSGVRFFSLPEPGSFLRFPPRYARMKSIINIINISIIKERECADRWS